MDRDFLLCYIPEDETLSVSKVQINIEIQQSTTITRCVALHPTTLN